MLIPFATVVSACSGSTEVSSADVEVPRALQTAADEFGRALAIRDFDQVFRYVRPAEVAQLEHGLDIGGLSSLKRPNAEIDSYLVKIDLIDEVSAHVSYEGTVCGAGIRNTFQDEAASDEGADGTLNSGSLVVDEGCEELARMWGPVMPFAFHLEDERWWIEFAPLFGEAPE